MDKINLKAEKRVAGAKARAMLNSGQVPCVLYGNEVENTVLQCSATEMMRAYQKAGESTLVNLEFDGKKTAVLFHDVQFDPISAAISHVDFYAVNMNKEIETPVPVKFTGEAPAIKNLGGVLVTTYDHLTVRCLPKDLPHNLTADISGLAEFGSYLKVSEVVIPEGVKILESTETVIATVQEPRSIKEEEEEKAEGEAVAEGETEEGKDEENKEEGEAGKKEEGKKQEKK